LRFIQTKNQKNGDALNVTTDMYYF